MTKKTTKNTNPLSRLLSTLVILAAGIIYLVSSMIGGGDSATPTATPPIAPTTSGTSQVQTIAVGQGSGAQKGFWQVYFTAPTGSRDRSTYVNGIDVPLALAIDSVQSTLDIAVFELNNEAITAAIKRAFERGVQVRIVTDDEHGLEDVDSTLVELEAEGIPIVDDNRSGLMHNKFMIMDGLTVAIGSTNYTMNGVYRNNNNQLLVRSRRLAQAYQAEFNEMFEQKSFGITSPKGNGGNFTQDGTSMEVWFASEDPVISEILQEVNGAQKSIHFMAFSFTRDDLGTAMINRGRAGITVEGVFERTGSETSFSQMTPIFCAGFDVRQDGNSSIMHHKVIIIDEATVITGSFNFSNNAVESNDENLFIIRDADLAAQYMAEFRRVQSAASRPTVGC